MIRRKDDEDADGDMEDEDDEDVEKSSPQSADFVDVIHTNGGLKLLSIGLGCLQVLIW